MPRIAVMGGGVCGLTAALLLARDGHEVTVLERDPAPVAATLEDAWERWERGGVVQFRQAHYLQPRGHAILADELPDVLDGLRAAGAEGFDVMSWMPKTIAEPEPRPGDERFRTVGVRRSTFEWVLARATADEPGVEVRRGVGVDALTATTADGIPHVTGVRTTTGETLRADLVVDACGRSSRLPRLLDAAGAAPLHEEGEDSGFLYYSRFFRARDREAVPKYRMGPVTPLPWFTILVLPGDNRTWSVTFYVPAGDRALKVLRHADRWTALLAACPLHAQFLEGEPVTGVMAMGGIVDRRRRLVTGGRPVATGVALLGDAWACTNPSLGRGMALGILHAQRLRDTVRDHLGDPRALAEAWDATTEAELTPWYRATVAEDRARLRQLDAARNGGPPPAPTGTAALAAALPAAATRDGDVFRAFIETRACLATPEEVLARPEVADRVVALAREAPSTIPGPTREEALALLA